LDPQGWVDVEVLLEAMVQHGHPLTEAQLHELVRTNDKKRFTLSADGTRIRAAQGHSVEVDLNLEPIEPPELLYHGTVQRFLESILREGLRPQARHHVHLSADRHTAQKVGSRRGHPLILEVKAGEMGLLGHTFFRSDNGVWLTDQVPPQFLRTPLD
jgi:putative RNA 2'-phosphotransferase